MSTKSTRPGGIARQDSRDCDFTFVNHGTEEGWHRLVPGRSGGMAAGRRSLAHEEFYFCISEAQFKVMAKGTALPSSTFVAIRNLCPSPLTS